MPLPLVALMVAQTALSVGSTIAGHSAQAKASRANARAARRAARLNSAELSKRGVQETIAAAAQANAIRRQTLAARSSLAASVASAGLTGNTVDALDAEFVAGQDAATGQLMQSLAWTLDSLQYNQVAEYAQMRSRIASVPPPNPFATGLQLGAGALDAYTRFRGLNTTPADASLPTDRYSPPAPPPVDLAAVNRSLPGLPGLPLMQPQTPPNLPR